MISSEYLFTYVKSLLLRPVARAPTQERVDELQRAFRCLGKGEINDRLLVLQRMIRLVTNQLDNASTSLISDTIVRLLHFHGPRASRFHQNAPPQDDRENKEIGLLSLKRESLPENHPNQQDDRENQEIGLLSLRRESLEENHPNQVSALANAYWTLLSLCLYPDGGPPSAESTARFFDLSPLYGQDPTPLRMLDGRGLLQPDYFSETYAAPFQPALAALLILWNRNHNYIAYNVFIRLAAARNSPTTPPKKPSKRERDDQIFNAAREINIMQFKNTICEDVLKGLLSLADTDPSPRLDILKDIANCPRGKQAASLAMLSFREVYFLYSINPMMGKVDCTTLETMMKQTNPDVNIAVLSSQALSQMYATSSQAARESLAAEDMPCLTQKLIQRAPVERPPQQKYGLYKDEDIALVLMDAREQAAGPPGGSLLCPTYTMMIERGALRQQREWPACTFNEFRKLYGLQPLRTFNAWNPNPDIWREAEKIYGNIDNLGLYVGLQCEAPIVATQEGTNLGFGFGFGFTKTYALLVDIVTRIRSQPVPDLDATLQKTDSDETWLKWVRDETIIKRPSGVNDAVLPKVLQRNFPRYFSANSAYSFFLFSTPSAFSAPQDSMIVQNHRISVDKPPNWPVRILTDFKTCQQVFEDTSGKFSTLYSDQLRLLTNDYGYLLGFDESPGKPDSNHQADMKSGSVVAGSKADLHAKDRQMTMFALIPDQRGTLKRYGNVFRRLTADYIVHRSIKQPDGTYKVNIIADVINNVCTRWVCETLCDYRLADDVDGSPNNDASGQKTTVEMYQEFANLSTFIFKMFGHADSYEARQAALKSSKYLREHIAKHIPRPDWLHTNVTLLEKASIFVWFIYEACKNILTAWWRPKELSSDTAQTFLRRAVQANRLIPLPKDELVRLMEERITAIADSKTRVNTSHVDDAERDIEVSRVVANVLGLAAVAAVNIPQVCAIVVSYYLNPERDSERKKIVAISKKPATSDDNKQLSAYIYEAIRINLPLGLWRRANGRTQVNGSTFEDNDLLFADFNYLHNQGMTDLADPQKVNIERGRKTYERLLGMGRHKCPALTQNEATSFMDQVIPEVIKAIFKLDGLESSEVQSSDKLTKGVDPRPHITNSSMYPKLYLDDRGDVSYYPQTLLVKYDSLPKESEYANKFGPQEALSTIRRRIIWIIECFIGAVTTFWMIYKAAVAAYATFTLILLTLGLGPRIRRPIKLPQMSDVQNLLIDCSPPLTIWEDWSPYMMKGGPDGAPLDIIFNSSFPVAHQLQLYDADQKDTKLAIYVDDILRALTTDFELDKAIDCGDNAYQCYLQQFSFGTAVIPPGSHSVRIAWAGKELLNGTYPDLGKNASRRVLVKRDYCAP